MTPNIGVAIITYQSPNDAQACLDSVIHHSPEKVPILLWDNSHDARTLVLAIDYEKYDHIKYVRSPGNVGCCVSRNHIFMDAIRKGLSHVCVLDQDVRVTADGWLDDMLAVFQKYPDTGCVAWKFIADQLQTGGYEMDETGATPQVPGACCMWSADAVRAIGGWYPGAMFYRLEDSDACLRAGLKGFKTRLVLSENKISHDRPSSGMARNPRDSAIRALSETIFQQRAHQFGYPRIPGVTY